MMVTLFRPSPGSRKVLQWVRCFVVGPEGGDAAHCRETHASCDAIRAEYPRANLIGSRWLNPSEIAQCKTGALGLVSL